VTISHANRLEMQNEELIKTGRYLFGNRWKTPLAKEIGVARETVSRWASGKQKIPTTAAKALNLLKQQPKALPYKEKRFRALGESKTIGDATLIHGDSRKVELLQQVDVILTDPVWPNAIDSLAGAHDPFRLFEDALLHLVQYLKPEGRIIVQMRCDSDPRILNAIPKRFSYLRTCWLPYAVPSRQGRVLISGDVAFVYGKAPKTRAGNHVMPGQPHSDFCPPAQPEKSGNDNKHPCPRNLSHVEWLIEKFTEPTDIILDPFCGSGTTAVGAITRGRQFIGIEIERKFIEITEQRIKQNNLYN
jgi:hypothetical protein